LPRPSQKAGQPLKGKFYYPRRGFGQISEALHEAARLEGADVRLGARATGLGFGARGHRVEYEAQGQAHELNAAHLWSTIPITVLARLARPAAPEPVLDAARSLRFRAMLLIYLVLETRQFSPYDAHYFPGSEIRITRLSEPKNYSARTEPRDVTVLCAELPCQVGDVVWNEDAASLGALVMQDLDTAGIPVRCPVRDIEVRRLPQAYPLYPVGFETAFDKLDAWAGGLSNVLTFGRQGLYAHDNTHHALHMAHVAVDCLSSAGQFDHAAWARARELFSHHVVED
jgi:protoporphyrinogen oxidase